jgi:hypothetical protein
MKKNLITRYDLSLVPIYLHPLAIDNLLEDDIESVLCLMDNMLGFHFILKNMKNLVRNGLLEKAFIHAYTSVRVNLQHIPMDTLEALLRSCDRKTLANSGDIIPDGDSFVLYRGISGTGTKRRERSLAWTSNLETAKWFAERLNYPHQTVIQATVPRENILFYTNQRNENDYCCLLDRRIRTKTIWTAPSVQTLQNQNLGLDIQDVKGLSL